jgi:hypothetical protein
VSPDSDAVRAVLRMATGKPDAQNWQFGELEAGLQASLVSVSTQGDPILGSHHAMVVKIFKSTPSVAEPRLRRQFNSLLELHAALNGRCANGWTVCTPEPLYVTYAPPALLMSKVPGRRLSSWLEDDVVPDAIFLTLPGALVIALHTLWSGGGLHGDLTFDNILCDVDNYRLSLVDPGLRTICTFGNEGGSAWSSLSHDLTHVLYDLSVSIFGPISHPIAYRRKWAFVDALVRECVDRAEMPQESLAEFQYCVRLHLQALGSSLLHALRKQIGLRRSARFFARLKETKRWQTVTVTTEGGNCGRETPCSG